MKTSIFLLSALLSTSTTASEPGQPFEVTDSMSANAVNIVKHLTHSQNVTYINFATLLQQNDVPIKLTLNEIKREVINNNKKYLFDFSAIKGAEEKQRAFDKVSDILGVSFEEDFLVISAFQGALLYTPVSSPDDPNVSVLETVATKSNSVPTRAKRSLSDSGMPQALPFTSQQKSGSPVLSFYVTANRPISDEECSFPSVVNWSSSDKSVFCDTPNISLIYKVEFLRSLPVTEGSETAPDKKLVRVTLAGEARGSGIHLNDTIDRVRSYRPGNGSIFDGWVGQYAYDAIALDYKVDVSASNGKARVLYKYPTDNVQSNYEHREVDGFTIGGTAGVEVSKKDGPKAKLEATASYTTSKWLTYKTTDYAIKLSTPNNRTFDISWVREQYNTADSLKTIHTQALTSNPPEDVINKGLIKPIGYSNFTPQMEVFYGANPNETGNTSITIDTSVKFSPIYVGMYRHFIGVGAWRSFQGQDFRPTRVNVARTFKVNWDHPIFLGGNPVNLQLGGFKNQCVSVDTNGAISLATCDSKDTKQSFIYDEFGRYVSTENTAKCLDGDNLNQLNQCSLSLTQRWQWVKDSDKLQNEYDDRVLTHDTQGSGLLLTSGTPEAGKNNKTLTFYTNIFDTGNAGFCNVHEWNGNDRTGTVGDVYYYRNPYSKTNDYFRLKASSYWYFPTDQTSNSQWEFIGHSYCDEEIEI